MSTVETATARVIAPLSALLRKPLCLVDGHSPEASQSFAIRFTSPRMCIISADGVWRFKLERPASATTKPARPGLMVAIDTPAQFEPFYTSDYNEDGNWHDLAVPGNWEMAGFSPATYNQPDNASGRRRTRRWS